MFARSAMRLPHLLEALLMGAAAKCVGCTKRICVQYVRVRVCVLSGHLCRVLCCAGIAKREDVRWTCACKCV